MSDVATLLERMELLNEGRGLPDDGEPCRVGTRGFYRENDAAVRCGSLAAYSRLEPVNRRLACELYDNRETIFQALRYWRDRKST